MAPARKGKSTAAKHDLPDKSQEMDGPSKKKKASRRPPTGKANDAIPIDDDESGPKSDKPESTQTAKQKPKTDLSTKPEPKQETRIKRMVKPMGDFPRFNSGDVVISLVLGSSKYSYQLHSSVLERASPWFRDILRLQLQEVEPDPDLFAKHPFSRMLRARFDLKSGPELKIPELRRTVFTYLMESELLPAPEQSVQSTPTPIGNCSDVETHSSAFPNPQSIKSTSGLMIGQRPEPQANASDLKAGHRKSRPDEKVLLRAGSSISTPPKIIEVDSVTDKSEPEEDIIMTNTGVIDQETADKEAGEANDQTSEDPFLMENHRSSSAVLAEVAEEKPPIKQENADDDSIMEEISKTYIIESAEGAPESQLLATQVLSSSSSFDATAGVPAADEEEFQSSNARQNPQAENSIQRKDVGGVVTAVTFKEKLDSGGIKKENVDGETIKAHAPDSTTDNATESIDGNEHVEADRDLMTGECFTDSVSTPVNEALSTKQAEYSDAISAAEPESSSLKQGANVVPVAPQAFNKEVPSKEEASNILVSGLRVEVDHLIKEEAGGTSPTTKAIEEKNVRDGKGPNSVTVCPGLDTTTTFKQGDPAIIERTHVFKQEAKIEKKHCDLPLGTAIKEGKKPESFATAGHAEVYSEKPSLQDDGARGRLPCIPQGDNTPEEKISNGNAAVQPSRARIGTVKLSNIFQALPGPNAIDQSTVTNDKSVLSVLGDAGQHHMSKTRSLSQRDTQEPQIRDGIFTPVSKEQSSGQSSALAVQITEGEKVQVAPTTMSDKPSKDYLEAYHNLFLMYYSRPPLIDTQDIENALKQSEHLIDVARLYGSIPIVRPYIHSALMLFGRGLYKAIMENPPRWIHLAVYLESAPIFKEGIIHIVANHPHWPWPTMEAEQGFSSVVQLLKKKLYALETLKESINKALFSNEVRHVEIFSRALNKDDFDTWFIVQYWRDWFTRSLAKANKVSDIGQKCVRGKVYRDLRRSGEAYLPTVLVLDAVEACRSKDLHAKAHRQGVERDLKTLKDFAQKVVEPLCANYSMLSVEDAGIDYLTCINVEDSELPWVKSVATR